MATHAINFHRRPSLATDLRSIDDKMASDHYWRPVATVTDTQAFESNVVAADIVVVGHRCTIVDIVVVAAVVVPAIGAVDTVFVVHVYHVGRRRLPIDQMPVTLTASIDSMVNSSLVTEAAAANALNVVDQKLWAAEMEPMVTADDNELETVDRHDSNRVAVDSVVQT